MKDVGKLERNGVGSQREIVPKVLTQFKGKCLPFMCHETGDCNTYVSESNETFLYNFQ